MDTEAERLAPWEPDDATPLPDVLEDRTQVEWALRRWAKLRATIAANVVDHDRMVTQIDEWLISRNAPLAEKAAKEERLIVGWLANRLEADPKSPKTEHLPSGTVAWSKGSLVVDVADETAFRVWAAANHPDLLRPWTPPEPQPDAPDKNAIKALVGKGLTPMGDPDKPGSYPLAVADEIVPGVAVVRNDPRIIIQPAEKENQ